MSTYNAKFKKVYFLARDGYLLYKLANEICEKNNLNIDCRYLYCSRFSLRMPSYHIIGDEAQKLLFSKGYYYTTKSVLERADLNENEIIPIKYKSFKKFTITMLIIGLILLLAIIGVIIITK